MIFLSFPIFLNLNAIKPNFLTELIGIWRYDCVFFVKYSIILEPILERNGLKAYIFLKIKYSQVTSYQYCK